MAVKLRGVYFSTTEKLMVKLGTLSNVIVTVSTQNIINLAHTKSSRLRDFKEWKFVY